MFKNIPENIRIIIVSSAPLAITLILFLIVGNFGISKLKDIRSQVSQSESDRAALTQKLTLLQTVSTTLGNSPDLATNALPSGNSALLSISQIKNLGFSNSLLLSNIKAGSEVKDLSGLSRVDISFEVDGTRGQIISFLKAIGTIAPLTLVDTVKLNESTGSTHATVSVKSFWSPLPGSLPAVGQKLSDLTADEKKIILTLGSLVQPAFLNLPPASGGGKTDPFSP